MIKANFLMEQHVGHETYALNLQHTISKLDFIDDHWIEVTYDPQESRIRSLPFIGPILTAHKEVFQGIRHRPGEINFFSTQVPAVLTYPYIRRWPYMLCTDVTPIQYDRIAHYFEDEYHEPDKENLFGRLKHRHNVRVFKRAKHFVAWSNWAADSLVQDYGLRANQISIIPPGIDLEQWRPPERINRAIDPHKPLQILFVGGEFPRKGGDLLINAFRHLPEGSAELHIVTRSEIKPDRFLHVYRDFEPNEPGLIQLYQSCDLFVLPSRAEPFGIAAAEAGACGLPAIVTRVGGLQEIVEDGESGFLIDLDDLDALISHIRTFIEYPDLLLSMREKTLKRISTAFNMKTNALCLAQMIQSAAVAPTSHSNGVPDELDVNNFPSPSSS